MDTDILRSRPRLRRIVERCGQRLLDAASATGQPPVDTIGAELPQEADVQPAPQEPEEQLDASPLDPACFAREVAMGRLATEVFPTTTRLYERLNDTDVDAIEQLIAS